MNREEYKTIEKLRNLIKEMYTTLYNNRERFSLNYPLSTLNKIKNYLDEILLEQPEDISLNTLLKQIKEKYDTMFFPKAGLSEFYLWDDDFRIRKQKNLKFDKLKDDILELLEEEEE